MLLPSTETGPRGGTLLIALHWLGGSARTWQPFANALAPHGIRTAALNLPGFGDAVDLHGHSLAQMLDAVRSSARILLAEQPGTPWVLAGHSMGGKLASLLAREALDGATGLEGLQALVLFSPSPPQPEPMKESSRESMLAQLGHSTGDPDRDRKRAERFLHENVGKLTLPAEREEAAVHDILRMNRDAFRLWLKHSSREDVRKQVGTLHLPALVFAGEDEAALGPQVQAEVMFPHLPGAQLIPLPAAGHLIPLERPEEAADLTLAFLATLDLLHAPTPALPRDFSALIHSARTSPATRAVLEQRLEPDASWHCPEAMDAEAFRTLRALVATVIPNVAFDLAARVDTTLAANLGDGWRPAGLPTDREAYVLGLHSLNAASLHHFHGVSFVGLDRDRRHFLLDAAFQGELDARTLLGHLHLGKSSPLYNAAQVKLWFEEARGMITRLYTADPRTYDRIGFAGFADDPSGFTHIQLEEARS